MSAIGKEETLDEDSHGWLTSWWAGWMDWLATSVPQSRFPVDPSKRLQGVSAVLLSFG